MGVSLILLREDIFMSMVSEFFKRVFPGKEHCDRDPGVDALMAVIRIVAKVGKGVAIFQAGGSALPVLLALGGSAIPDIIKLMQEYDDIPCEVGALNADSYALLLRTVMEEFGLSRPEAKETVASAIRLVTDIKTTPFN